MSIITMTRDEYLHLPDRDNVIGNGGTVVAGKLYISDRDIRALDSEHNCGPAFRYKDAFSMRGAQPLEEIVMELVLVKFTEEPDIGLDW